MFSDYTFRKRIALFIALDIAVTFVGSFVPEGLWPVKTALSVLQLSLMTATMLITVLRVLEDY
jgi:hypothetical protein